MEQIVEVQGRQASAVLGSGAVGIKPASVFSFGPRDVTPADFLGVGEDTSVDGFVFAGRGHELRDAVVEIPYAHFYTARA